MPVFVQPFVDRFFDFFGDIFDLDLGLSTPIRSRVGVVGVEDVPETRLLVLDQVVVESTRGQLVGLEKWWKVVVDGVRRFDPDRQDGVGGVGVGGVFLVSACGA